MRGEGRWYCLTSDDKVRQRTDTRPAPCRATDGLPFTRSDQQGRQILRQVHTSHADPAFRDDDDAHRSGGDLEAVEEVERDTGAVGDQRTDDIPVADHGTCAFGVPDPKAFEHGDRARLDGQHELAAGYRCHAPERIEPGPSGLGSKLIDGATGPGAELDLGERLQHLDRETASLGKRSRGLQCPWQRTGDDSIDWDRLDELRDATGLGEAGLVQVNAGRASGHDAPDVIVRRVADEEERGHDEAAMRTSGLTPGAEITWTINAVRLTTGWPKVALLARILRASPGPFGRSSALMKLVIFGLTMSSSWGNGHATLWRGLCRSLVRRGHEIVFFERDVPYYAAHRDLAHMDGVQLVLYDDWSTGLPAMRKELAHADAAMVTSYCPDGVTATDIVGDCGGLKVFYDLDTPVTLDAIKTGQSVDYIGPRGLCDFDLVLSFTGGRALDDLRAQLGARAVSPLYGHVDPETHRPAGKQPQYDADLSYLGTYAADRQSALEELFVDPARRAPNRRFVIGGAQYPDSFPWASNIYFVQHLPPGEHASFFSSSTLTLNVTRRAMAEMGFCPSGRLFEAAACGVPILSDCWPGLETFFTPDVEILIARNGDDTLRALDRSPEELRRLALAARERTLAEHTADRRAQELEAALEYAASPVSS